MKKYLILLLSFFSISWASGQYESGVTIPDSTGIISDQDLPRIKYASTISADEMKHHLSILASDEFEGRETGKHGNELAAQYISDHFKQLDLQRLGVENSYFQQVNFTWTSWENAEIFVNGERYKHLWEFLSFPAENEHQVITSDEVIFLGYGIDDPVYSDYKKAKKLKGKTILIYTGEPVDPHGMSRITGEEQPSEWSSNIEKKLRVAKKYGVAEVLVITDNIQALMADNRHRLLGPSVQIGTEEEAEIDQANCSYISTNIAKAIFGEKVKKVIKARDRISKSGRSRKVCLPVDIEIKKERRVSRLDGKNVLGYIEGTDKKDELIVVSGHFDHLGKRGEDIYNGADDNGSGTTAILELADAFSQAVKMGDGPRRSILFLLVTGEEKGLLGSEFYTRYPVIPLENTICNVNIDMIGRTDKKYDMNPNYIYVIGSDRLSSELHRMNERINQDYTQITLDYTYNDEKDPNRYYYRSDHYNFAENGIPAIFFFSGVHKDYHRTTDTVEKIDFQKMEKIGRHIFQLIWELANTDDAIEVDAPSMPEGSK